MPRNDPRLRKLTPAEIHRILKGLADHYGYRLHVGQHGLTTASYSDGFPTFALVGHGRLVFLTLADPKGRLTRPAASWVEDLTSVEVVRAHIVDRADLESLGDVIGTPEARA